MGNCRRWSKIARNRVGILPILSTMMDPAVKTAMAFCVLLVGVCTAMLFRRDPPRAARAAPRPRRNL